MPDPRRPEVVLIHGAVLNGGMWGPVVEALAGEYQVHTPDLPGHGSRSNEPFRLSRAVEIIRDLARSIAPTPIITGGDSLGGYASIAAAASLGDRLKGAVLGGCTANFQGPTFLLYRMQLGLTRLFDTEKLVARLSESIKRKYPAAAAGILAGGIRADAFGEAIGELRQFDARAALAAIRAPVVLVNGTRDFTHRLGERGTLAAAPRATLRHFAGTGHGVSLIRPAEFAALIREAAQAAAATGGS